MRLAKGIGVQRLVALGLGQLGQIDRQQGDYSRAEALLSESLQLGRSNTRAEGFGGMIVYNLGLIAEDRGDLQRARDLYAQSISLRRAFGERSSLAYTLEGFVTVAERQGQAERALVLAGAAAAARVRFGNPIAPFAKERLEQAVDRAWHDLGGDAEGAWSRGQAMTIDDALTFAVQDA